jgi:polysaccharide biosynthesis transport protein
VLAWAEANYDQVLIDCPPILAAADAAIIGRLTEGLILVIQPEKNHRRLVLRAVSGLSRSASA